jgi:hypothetical protein
MSGNRTLIESAAFTNVTFSLFAFRTADLSFTGNVILDLAGISFNPDCRLSLRLSISTAVHLRARVLHLLYSYEFFISIQT